MASSEKSSSTRPIVIAILVGSVLIAIGLGVGLAIGLRGDDDDGETPPTVAVGEELSKSGSYRHASVVADSKVCSDIGTDIMARLGGNAVDGAVAALFCTGVVSAHSAGIGGGSFYTIYHKATKKFYSADSRESAPAAATENMYAGVNNNKSTTGGMASGVPGEVLGLFEVHARFGRVPWRSLVRPTVTLCENGVPLTAATQRAVRLRLTAAPDHYKQKFTDYLDADGNAKPEDSLIKLPKLAKTFQTIADDPYSFYNGTLAGDVVADLKDEGGILELEDLATYKVKWSEPTMLALPGGHQIYSTPPPGSGPVLNFILNILSGYGMSPNSVKDDASQILTMHRTVEAMKFAFGKRTEFGDETFISLEEHKSNMSNLAFGEYFRSQVDDARTQLTSYYNPTFSVQDDHGTAHISVIDGEGNAVSVTSTINTYFGSKVKGTRTGIVFNNEMDDFSTFNTTNYFGLQASPANYIRQGKRPLSSMCPAIVVDSKSGDVRLVTGAAGGSKITTATALSIMNELWFGYPLQESVDLPRYHHQLMPKELQLEATFSQAIKDGLRAKGHTLREVEGVMSVVQAIAVQNDGTITGTSDFRKGGSPNGF